MRAFVGAVAVALLVGVAVGELLPGSDALPDVTLSAVNPYRRPAGPVYGETCAVDEKDGLEKCPVCVQVAKSGDSCVKFTYFTPNATLADAFDKAKEEGDVAAPKCAAIEGRCAGAEGHDFAYLGCCSDDLACVKNSTMGWGRFCLPKLDYPDAKTCTLNNKRCAGEADKSYVDFYPCCSDDYECVEDKGLGWGSWCLPKDDKKAIAVEKNIPSPDPIPVDIDPPAPAEMDVPVLRFAVVPAIDGDLPLSHSSALLSVVRQGYQAEHVPVKGINGAACAASGDLPNVVDVPTATATEYVHGIVVNVNCPTGKITKPVAALLKQAACLAFEKPQTDCYIVNVQAQRIFIAFKGTQTVAQVEARYERLFDGCQFQRFVVDDGECDAMSYQVSKLADPIKGGGGPRPAASARPTPAASRAPRPSESPSAPSGNGFGCTAGATNVTPRDAVPANPDFSVAATTITVPCSSGGMSASAAESLAGAVAIALGYSRNQVRITGSGATSVTISFYTSTPDESGSRIEYYFTTCQFQGFVGAGCDSMTQTTEEVLAPATPTNPDPSSSPVASQTPVTPAGFGCRPGGSVAVGAPVPRIRTFSVVTTVVRITCGGGGGGGASINGADAETIAAAVAEAIGYARNQVRITGGTGLTVSVSYYSLQPQGSIDRMNQVSSGSCSFQTGVGLACTTMSLSTTVTGQPLAAAVSPSPSASSGPTAPTGFGCRAGGAIAVGATVPRIPTFAVVTTVVRTTCGAGGATNGADAEAIAVAVAEALGYARNQVRITGGTGTTVRVSYYSLEPQGSITRMNEVGSGSCSFQTGVGLSCATMTLSTSVTGQPLAAATPAATPSASPAAPAASPSASPVASAGFGCRAGSTPMSAREAVPAIASFSVVTMDVQMTCTSGGLSGSEGEELAQAVASAQNLARNQVRVVRSNPRRMSVSFYSIDTAASIQLAATAFAAPACPFQTSLGVACSAMTQTTTVTEEPLAGATPSASPSPSTSPSAPTNNCRLRKECRDMSRAEWNAYSAAVVALNAAPSQLGGASRYADFVAIHANEVSSGHQGSQFLPWHRAFIYEYETALREIDPSVSLCYWDWSVDAMAPGDSAIWSANFFGGSNGQDNIAASINSGPFANFQRFTPTAGSVGRMFTPGATTFPARLGETIRDQDVGQGYWATRGTLNAYIGDSAISFANFATTIEALHGTPHIEIGGDMRSTPTAPNDPIFYAHHGFIDKIWQDWQATGSNRLKYGGNHNGQAVTNSARMRGILVSQLLLQGPGSSAVCVTYQRSQSSGVRMAIPDVSLVTSGRASCAEEGYAKTVDLVVGGGEKFVQNCIYGFDLTNSNQIRDVEYCQSLKRDYLSRCATDPALAVAEEDLESNCAST